MTIPTEPIGSIPRPLPLLEAIRAYGDHADPRLEPLYEEAIRDTVRQFEATGSPVITDGEQRIGVHTCPGGDRDSTHSADVDYAELLPSLFELNVGNFYIALAGEKDRVRVLKIIRKYLKADQRAFVGVVSPIDPHVDTPEEVRDRVLEAAEHIPLAQLGTTDDCGFSPFCDDTSTTRETAFATVPVAVLTSSAEEIDRKRARELGADCYLLKPPTTAMLLSCCRQFGLECPSVL